MGRYVDIADSVPRASLVVAGTDADASDPTEPDTAKARRLRTAGWKPKVSFGGVVIWQRPDNGFYRSEEAALCLLDQWEAHLLARPSERGKRGKVTQREGVTR